MDGQFYNLEKLIKENISKSISVKTQLLESDLLIRNILKAANEIVLSYKKGGKTLLAGNGGSAADAQHLSGEFVSRFYFDRPGLASVALTTDTSILTAIGNDYGFDKLFSRQIQANGNPEDVFIAISTSGNSKNIVEALKESKKRKIFTIGFTGQNKCLMDDLCDICIKVPSTETPRIQEAHILIGHIICEIVEKEIFSKNI